MLGSCCLKFEDPDPGPDPDPGTDAETLCVKDPSESEIFPDADEETTSFLPCTLLLALGDEDLRTIIEG